MLRQRRATSIKQHPRSVYIARTHARAPLPPQHFNDIGQAKGSKLVRRLLKIEAVSSVFLGREFISVNKREGASWAVRRAAV